MSLDNIKISKEKLFVNLAQRESSVPIRQCQNQSQGYQHEFFRLSLQKEMNFRFDILFKTCSTGHFCPVGSEEQIRCPLGHFSGKVGRSQCEKCPVNVHKVERRPLAGILL